MSGLKSRNKGKAGEREIVLMLTGAAIQVENELQVPDALRTSKFIQRNLQQSIDGGDDIIGVHGHSVEVKNCVTLALPAWWVQCTAQAQARRLRPLLVYRVGQGRGARWMARTWMLSDVGGPWIVCDMPFESYIPAYKAVLKSYFQDVKAS